MGPQYADVQSYANRVQQELVKVKELRDVEFEEPLRYPTVNVHVDRVLAGQLGATAMMSEQRSLRPLLRVASSLPTIGAIPNPV